MFDFVRTIGTSTKFTPTNGMVEKTREKELRATLERIKHLLVMSSVLKSGGERLTAINRRIADRRRTLGLISAITSLVVLGVFGAEVIKIVGDEHWLKWSYAILGGCVAFIELWLHYNDKYSVKSSVERALCIAHIACFNNDVATTVGHGWCYDSDLYVARRDYQRIQDDLKANGVLVSSSDIERNIGEEISMALADILKRRSTDFSDLPIGVPDHADKLDDLLERAIHEQHKE